MLTKISFKKSKFWIDSFGILNCKHFNRDMNWRLDKDEVEKYILAILTLAADKPRSLIVDFRDVRGTYTILAARLFAKDPSVNKLIISEAFIVNSISIRLLVNAYKRIYEPLIPFKIFSNIKDAQQYSIKQIELTMESNKNNNYEVKSSNLII